jgi:hypothetical protein
VSIWLAIRSTRKWADRPAGMVPSWWPGAISAGHCHAADIR